MATSKRTTWIIVTIVGFVVLSLLGVAGFVILGSFAAVGQIADAERTLAEARANSLVTAAQMYVMQEAPGACPTVTDLAEDAFLEPDGTRDPWDQDFIIECEGETLRVRSRGPDGTANTDDDILVEDRPAD